MELKAQVEFLEYIVLHLCLDSTYSPEERRKLVEKISTPITTDSPEATRVIHAVAERLIAKLDKHSAPLRDHS